MDEQHTLTNTQILRVLTPAPAGGSDPKAEAAQSAGSDPKAEAAQSAQLLEADRMACAS